MAFWQEYQGFSSTVPSFWTWRAHWARRIGEFGTSNGGGGTFPCANGAASSYLAESTLKGNIALIKVPGPVIPLRSTRLSAGAASSNNTLPERPSPAAGGIPACKKHTICALESPQIPSFRRYQTLHVLHVSKSSGCASWISKLDKLLSSTFITAVTFIFKVSLAVIFTLFGMYGTAVVILCNSTTQLATRVVKADCPLAFLSNNEDHDACMLVGTHQNSSLWYLFVGDRAIVDSLLNKTMVVIPQQLGAAAWLKAAHIIQLLAVTFVASQKGWDGITLLILLIVSAVMELRFQRQMLSRMFCELNGVALKQKSFEFSGRTSMLGAIQRFSESDEWKWMDEIWPSAQGGRSRRELYVEQTCR